MVKKEYIQGLIVLLDLREEDAPQLNKMSVEILERIFEGIKSNALAYQELASENKLF